MKSLLASGVSYKQLALEGHGYEDALKKKFPNAYVPSTASTPGAEADVSVPIELDNTAEETTNGETTVETKTIPDDKTTKDTKRGFMQKLFGSKNLTKGGTGRKGSNPIKPVSLATNGSQSKDFNLKLNNQAVGKPRTGINTSNWLALSQWS